MNSILAWLWTLLISIDQFFNVLLSLLLNKVFNPKHKFGNEDETLSSVMGKNVRAGSCRACHIICKYLSFIDKNHCKKSIEEDEHEVF